MIIKIMKSKLENISYPYNIHVDITIKDIKGELSVSGKAEKIIFLDENSIDIKNILLQSIEVDLS